MKQSAGLLLYRRGTVGWEMLVVHGSGWYNRGKPWGIPKGLPDEGEELEAAARRETREETGIAYDGPVTPLGSSRYQKSRKEVHAFAALAPEGVEPRCASWEIDGAEFVSIDEARRRFHPDQAVFLDRLLKILPT